MANPLVIDFGRSIIKAKGFRNSANVGQSVEAIEVAVAEDVSAGISADDLQDVLGGIGDRLAAVEAVDVVDILTAADALTALAGTLTGTTDGTLADVAAIALSTSNTYTDAAVNSAVNTAITSVNLQLKELQATVNAIIAALQPTA